MRIYVISPAGKPVWCSDADLGEDELAPTCGVATAVLALAAQNGETVEGFTTPTARVAITRRGEFVMVAVGALADADAALRKRLDVAHDAMLMVLTAGVHRVLKKSPNRDVRDLLGSSTATILDGLARRMDAEDGCGPLSILAGACPALPFPPDRRAALGHVLASAETAARDRCPSSLYADPESRPRLPRVAPKEDPSLSKGTRSSSAAARCWPRASRRTAATGGSGRRTSSSSSISSSLAAAASESRPSKGGFRERGLSRRSQKKAFALNESWTPVCLPRFDDRGFLHAYVAYLDASSGLCLVLLAGDDSAATFATFRGARRAIENALDRDGLVAAAAEAARTRAGPSTPAGCLHAAVVRREGDGRLAQCAATAAFEAASTWRAYDELARALGGGDDGAASAALRSGEPALATRRGCTYVAVPGRFGAVFATFPAHRPSRAIVDDALALARSLEGQAQTLFADPFPY